MEDLAELIVFDEHKTKKTEDAAIIEKAKKIKEKEAIQKRKPRKYVKVYTGDFSYTETKNKELLRIEKELLKIIKNEGTDIIAISLRSVLPIFVKNNSKILVEILKKLKTYGEFLSSNSVTLRKNYRGNKDKDLFQRMLKGDGKALSCIKTTTIENIFDTVMADNLKITHIQFWRDIIKKCMPTLLPAMDATDSIMKISAAIEKEGTRKKNILMLLNKYLFAITCLEQIKLYVISRGDTRKVRKSSRSSFYSQINTVVKHMTEKNIGNRDAAITNLKATGVKFDKE